MGRSRPTSLAPTTLHRTTPPCSSTSTPEVRAEHRGSQRVSTVRSVAPFGGVDEIGHVPVLRGSRGRRPPDRGLPRPPRLSLRIFTAHSRVARSPEGKHMVAPLVLEPSSRSDRQAWRGARHRNRSRPRPSALIVTPPGGPARLGWGDGGVIEGLRRRGGDWWGLQGMGSAAPAGSNELLRGVFGLRARSRLRRPKASAPSPCPRSSDGQALAGPL